jgi:glycosyltransferase involved in cell wall biosynthesis
MSRTVSVVVPCYQHGRYLPEAIESVLAQDYPEKEVIVVNDGSPDDTAAVARRFGDDVVYLEQPHRGPSAARNAGIRVASGDYIALLDADDVLLPGSLSLRAAVLDAEPSVGLVSGASLEFDESGIRGQRRGPPSPHNFRWETVRFNEAMGAVMLRRDCLARFGGFDEELDAAEDWMCWVHVSLYADMIHLTQPVVALRQHPDQTTHDRERCDRAHRTAVAKLVRATYFGEYPRHFQAQILFFRFATAWRVEPKHRALRYFARGVRTDPRQLPNGLRVIREGLRHTLERRRRR